MKCSTRQTPQRPWGTTKSRPLRRHLVHQGWHSIVLRLTFASSWATRARLGEPAKMVNSRPQFPYVHAVPVPDIAAQCVAVSPMLQLQFDPGSIPDASTCATNVVMAGSAGGHGRRSGSRRSRLCRRHGGRSRSGGRLRRCRGDGAGDVAGTMAGEASLAVAVTALFILSTCPLPAASTTCTAADEVGLGADAPSDRAPPEVVMATAPEARAIASHPDNYAPAAHVCMASWPGGSVPQCRDRYLRMSLNEAGSRRVSTIC